jgi:hypothetical protein
MPAIAATDVTYTQRSNPQDGHRRIGGFRRMRTRVQFGNASLTYPAGGVPLTAASLGCPNVVNSLVVVGQVVAAGDENVHWRWNGSTSAPKLFGAAIDATAASTDEREHELPTSYAPAAQDLEVEAEGW